MAKPRPGEEEETQTPPEEEGQERVRRAKKRTSKRKKKASEEELPPEPEPWFKPPTPEELAKHIKVGIDTAKHNLAIELRNAHDPADPQQVKDLETFTAAAVAGDLEVFVLSMGLSGMMGKYEKFITKYAPEICTVAGFCFLSASMLKLRRQRADIVKKWNKDKQKSS